ncbi:MAG TPA: hypothetical protein VEW28_10570 [Candidatus Kapabacteria bacterium]|nr:hypothetical protein [Candidatus Kapabacteria bacterium]
MWSCFKACVKAALPGVGIIVLGLIIGGLIALAATGIGLTAAGVIGVIGVAIAAPTITTLLRCLAACI